MSSQAVRRLRVLDVVRSDDGIELVERSTVGESPTEVAALAPTEGAEALVVWDVELPLPPTELLERLLDGPCHVWHAGLRLGQADRPAAWNLCHGRAMFSCDVDPSIESTSWKLSLRAVVVRNQVIEAFGGFDAAFDTPAGTALEAGLRWISHGALMRHVPDLLPTSVQVPPDAPPSPADGLRIVRRQLATGGCSGRRCAGCERVRYRCARSRRRWASHASQGACGRWSTACQLPTTNDPTRRRRSPCSSPRSAATPMSRSSWVSSRSRRSRPTR